MPRRGDLSIMSELTAREKVGKVFAGLRRELEIRATHVYTFAIDNFNLFVSRFASELFRAAPRRARSRET